MYGEDIIDNPHKYIPGYTSAPESTAVTASPSSSPVNLEIDETTSDENQIQPMAHHSAEEPQPVPSGSGLDLSVAPENLQTIATAEVSVSSVPTETREQEPSQFLAVQRPQPHASTDNV